MLAALASATLIVAGSLLVGQAVLALCGRRAWTWLAGPIGLALLLAVAAIAASLDARGTLIAICVGALLALAAAAVAWRGRGGRGPKETLRNPCSRSPRVHAAESPSDLHRPGPALGAAILAALFAALPFIAAGTIGILGVGLVNDDMSSHLLIADWIEERFRPEPVFIDQGYPLGPHALVAGLAALLHASSIDVFAGLVLAVPMLSALVAFSALDGLRLAWRVPCAALVALPYMAAAYLAQEAFKEPILALFVLSFALLLAQLKGAREAIPLGVLAAGAVYVYSFPGLAWLAGTAIAWAAIELVRGKPIRRPALIGTGLGIGALIVLIAPEIPRLLDFKDFRALDPERANEGGLGNLRDQISPLTAFGIWPTSEFRLPAGAGSLPAVAFYAAALVGALAFCLALPRWIRRHGAAIPAALLAAVALYVFARAWGTVYTSGKAIVIIAPLITLVTLGGLLAIGNRRMVLTAGAAVIVAGMALSSFLILRQAPVAPDDHMNELAEIRPLVEGEKLLFLGRDNFILYELRGSRPFTHVRNFYGCRDCFVEPNFELEAVGSKFDFDAVEAETLERFPYVLTTRAAYASGPPPSYEVAAETANYVLWRRNGEVGDRLPAERGPEPGAPITCDRPRSDPPELAGAGSATEPFTVAAESWSETTIEGGEEAVIEFDVPRGRWLASLRYDSTRPVALEITSGNTNTVPLFDLPGNLDYRGTAPFWPAGEILAGADTTVRVTATVEDLPLAGRLLGGHSTAHLGELALSPGGDSYVDGIGSPAPGSGTTLLGPEQICAAADVDWLAGSSPGRAAGG